MAYLVHGFRFAWLIYGLYMGYTWIRMEYLLTWAFWKTRATNSPPLQAGFSDAGEFLDEYLERYEERFQQR